MANEPMSDERLAEIRRMDSRAEVSMMASSDVAVRDLLAEVDLRRTREAAALEMLREMTDYSELTLGAVNGPLYRRARALLAGE